MITEIWVSHFICDSDHKFAHGLTTFFNTPLKGLETKNKILITGFKFSLNLKFEYQFFVFFGFLLNFEYRF